MIIEVFEYDNKTTYKKFEYFYEITSLDNLNKNFEDF